MAGRYVNRMIAFEGPVLVTGTDTGVGKTVATAALAAYLMREGRSVEVIKIAQTGDDDDAAEVNRLSGAPARALAFYPDPLAPFAAARRSGLPLLELDEVAETVLEEAAVVVSPGSMYGPSGEGFFRISLTAPDERIEEAVERMREHLA